MFALLFIAKASKAQSTDDWVVDTSYFIYNEGDILINEILFNPPPDGADYVELYNRTDYDFPLSDFYLVVWKNEEMGKAHRLADSGYFRSGSLIAVTTDTAWVRRHYPASHPERLVQMKSMPAYNDASGTVMLCDRNGLVFDRLDYTASMHSELMQNVEGVALERRSLSAATQLDANWTSASFSSGYGTPTAPNSQRQDLFFVQNEFVCEPSIFSPDGDGYCDELVLTYSMSEADMCATISIFDNQGHRIRQLVNNGLLGTAGMITWNGLDDKGLRCHRGAYILVVEVYNEIKKRHVTKIPVYLVVN